MKTKTLHFAFIIYMYNNATWRAGEQRMYL